MYYIMVEDRPGEREMSHNTTMRRCVKNNYYITILHNIACNNHRPAVYISTRFISNVKKKWRSCSGGRARYHSGYLCRGPTVPADRTGRRARVRSDAVTEKTAKRDERQFPSARRRTDR